jgi:hypothetical protein
MKNIIEDVNKLTDVSENTLKKFIPIINYSIAHIVHENHISKKDIAVIDLEIGELHIKFDSEGVRYRFVPSKELEQLVNKTIVSKQSPIITKLEGNLQTKIDRAYKELL